MSKITQKELDIALSMSLFSSFSPEETGEVISALEGEIERYPRGSILVAAGQQAPAASSFFFLLLSGRVHMIRYGLQGEQCMIDYLMPGCVLGMPQAIGGARYFHNAMQAGADCTLLRLALPGQNASPLVQRLLRNLLQVVSRQNVRLMEKVDVLSGRSVREKILIYLRIESEIHGSREFDIPLKRQELADYIYVDRTTLSHELGKMQQEGLLSVRRNHFVLTPEGLT
ncbi:MAG: Crp/Fnr family transcriptional regulator [Oscillospiraceae bacterium]|nr:Crp/Fnr family transcriptional regulator [Oscillospiraceae bacterium]